MSPLSSSVSTPPSDADLVARIRRGDRDGFGLVVERYQSLVCALAYSACGNTTQSEDVAQEVFTSAWRQIQELREPTRLKAWLCGITRHSAAQAYRHDRREPAQIGAAFSGEEVAPEPPPCEQAMRREEELLLWRALARLPESYREVLVLYYREHRSIEHVASALDLSEDNVRQRLSRGRKALQDEVHVMLEDTLAASAPGPEFKTAVLGALPSAALGSAVASGGSALKGGTVAKIGLAGLTGLSTWLGGLLMPLLGMVIQIRQAETPRDRSQVITMWMALWAACGVFVGGIYALSWGSHFYGPAHSRQRALVLITVTAVYTLVFGILVWRCVTGRQPPSAWKERARHNSSDNEFRTRTRFLGMPLVHIQYGHCAAGQRPPAKGWIAIGRVAYGGLFASGTLAVAPISIGLLSVGLLSFGCIGIGVFSVGSLAFGTYALGGIAAGYLAWGGCALGWHAAVGGAVWARDFALGSRAATIAAHANGPIARRAISGMFFFRHAEGLFVLGLMVTTMPLFVSYWKWRRSHPIDR